MTTHEASPPASSPTSADPDVTELQRLSSFVERRRTAFLTDLEALVNIDCGSYTKAGVDRVGEWVAERMRSLGAEVDIQRNVELGNTVVGTWATTSHDGDNAGPRLLLIGHMDTVFDEGTAAERPFAIQATVRAGASPRASGPGVTDMKAGLLAGLYAIEAVRDLSNTQPFERLTFVANPDEEIGSPASTPVIRAAARDADACLVLECARANGDIVSSRKGILDLRITVHGRAAHAGVEPEKGRSAILAAAHLVVALHELNGRWPSVTVNAGTIAGGTRPNVVAERCVIEVDVRASRREELEAAEVAIRDLAGRPAVPDVRIELEQAARHWPMEKLERSGRLVEHAVRIAQGLGFDVRDAATGGASDANTTAGMGVPTIDGLGPIGGNDHSPSEYLEVDSVVPRTALLAGLLLAISRDPEIVRWREERTTG
jgi:glutamate carboxypeptidase